MPAMVRKRGNKFRVVEPSNGDSVKLVRGTGGTPVDGGGHKTRAAARRQAQAINASKEGG
jgi:hypothetical protein